MHYGIEGFHFGSCVLLSLLAENYIFCLVFNTLRDFGIIFLFIDLRILGFESEWSSDHFLVSTKIRTRIFRVKDKKTLNHRGSGTNLGDWKFET